MSLKDIESSSDKHSRLSAGRKLHQIDTSLIPIEDRIASNPFVYIFQDPVNSIPDDAVLIRRYLYPLIDVATQYRRNNDVKTYNTSKNNIQKQIDRYNKRLGLTGYQHIDDKEYSKEHETHKLQVRRKNLIDTIDELEMPRGESFLHGLEENSISLYAQSSSITVESSKLYMHFAYDNQGIILNVYIDPVSRIPMVVSDQVSSSGISAIINILYSGNSASSSASSDKSESDKTSSG